MKITHMPEAQDVPGLEGNWGVTNTKSLSGAVRHCHPRSDLKAFSLRRKQMRLTGLRLALRAVTKDPEILSHASGFFSLRWH